MKNGLILVMVAIAMSYAFASCVGQVPDQPLPKVEFERRAEMAGDEAWKHYDKILALNLRQYPKNLLTKDFLAFKGLEKIKLDKDVRGFNLLDRRKKQSEDITLKPGTEVLVWIDNNVVAAKWVCLNPFYAPVTFTSWPVIKSETAFGKTKTSVGQEMREAAKTSPKKGKSLWSTLSGWLSKMADIILASIGFLILLAILAAAITGFIWLLRRLYVWLQSIFVPTTIPPRPPEPPIAPPGPISPTPPAPPIVPGPAANEHGVGVFAGPNGAIRVVNHGADSHVTILNGHATIEADILPVP